MNRIRTAVYAATLVIGTILVAILGFPLFFFGENAVRNGAQLWARFALVSLRIICGVGYRIEGREFIPSGGALIAANHQSMWETIALFALLDKPVLVFKKELLKVPIYGWWALKAGGLPVDREAGAKALKALTKAARAKIEADGQVVLFPEGTRAAVGEKLPLQPGVASIYLTAKAPCTPARHDSGRFWLLPGGVMSLKTPGLITLRFMPAIPPGLARKAFMTELEERLQGEDGAIAASGATEGEAAA